MYICMFYVTHLMVVICYGYNWTRINLPESHLSFFFHNNPDVKKECEVDAECPYKVALKEQRCWGYEANCSTEQRLSVPQCEAHEQQRARNREPPSERFWEEGDFGYVKGKKDELYTFCQGNTEADSSFSCTKYARYCYARNLYIDMTDNTLERVRQRGMSYTTDFWQEGEIGGHCKFDKERFQREDRDKRQLASWYAELENFTSLPFKPTDEAHCDVIFDKPVIFMKLDAGVNMYHHFCDFINLYISQHINNSFSTDVQIILWVLNSNRYGDMFKETFDAFTEHPIDFLYNYHSKRICVREAMFPILARATYGLYYSTSLVKDGGFSVLNSGYIVSGRPNCRIFSLNKAEDTTFWSPIDDILYKRLTPGCYGSSLFKAFSQHLLHRLKIAYEKPKKDKIRVTLLDRASKKRNILNQDEVPLVDMYLFMAGWRSFDKSKLAATLRLVDEFEVRLVAYKFREMSFLDQIKMSHNSDIFIGMHGAGLTHMFFQPDWGAVIEVYNCEDVNCYLDLARLRGMKYFTWEKPDKVYPQSQDPDIMPKFNNYTLDKDEVLRLAIIAADYVRSNPAFIKARDSSLRDEKDSSLQDERDSSLPDDRESSLQDLRDSSLRDERDTSFRDERESSLLDERDSSLRDERDSSLRDERDSSLRDDRDSSLRDDRDSSLRDDRDSSLRDDRDSSLRDEL